MRRWICLGVVACALACAASGGSADSQQMTIGDGTTGGATATTESTATAATSPTGNSATSTSTSSSATTSTSMTEASTATTTPTGADASGSSGTDSGDDTSTTEPDQVPRWLLSIDESDAIARLIRISTETGVGTDLCLLPAGRNYNSLTFSRDGVLFAHSVNETAIDRIDPCDCTLTRITSTLLGNTQVTADAANGLHGVDLTADVFVSINVATGAVTEIGSLGIDVEGMAVAWSDAVSAPYLLDAISDALYTINPTSGAAENPVALTTDFTTVGLEYHHPLGRLFACSGDAVLYEIDPADGTMVPVGEIGGALCDNLAAPWDAVDCIEDR